MIQVSKNKKSTLNGNIVSSTSFSNTYGYNAGSNNNIFQYDHILGSSQTLIRRTTANHNDNDQLINLQGSINRTYTYYPTGEIKTMTNCFGTTSYEYDTFNNLKKVILADGKIIEYKLDAFGRRIVKLVNSQVQEYYLWYDQTKLAAILDSNKQPKLIYIYGPESDFVPSFVIKDNQSYKIVHDPGTNSVRYVIDTANSTIMQELEYDEYGNIMKNTNPTFQPLGFAGGLRDNDTKLIRFGARDYDSTVGRWTTKDPIGFNGGDTNLYAYVGGNPMSYVDPSGLTQEDINNAVRFTSQFIPQLNSVKFGIINDPDVIGQTSVFKNQILLNKTFLGKLNNDQMIELLDTVYHEGLHIQGGYSGLARNVWDSVFNKDKAHRQINMQSSEFTYDQGKNFLKSVGRRCEN